MFHKHLAPICEGDRLAAVDEHGLELILQTFDLCGYGRLRQIKELPALRKLIVLEMVISVSNWLIFIAFLLT